MKKKIKRSVIYPLPDAKVFLKILFSSFIVQTIMLALGYYLNSIAIIIIIQIVLTFIIIVGSKPLSDNAKQLMASVVVAHSVVPLLVCGYVLTSKSFTEGLKVLSNDKDFPFIAVVMGLFLYFQFRATWFKGDK